MPPMSKVDLYAAIRRGARAGLSSRALESKYRVGRRTVTAALASAWPKPRKRGAGKKRVSAPRGAVCSDGGERPPSPRRRSGGVKLEAAWAGGRRGGWEQPRQSCVGPELPDGTGAVSETRRYTRGTGVYAS